MMAVLLLLLAVGVVIQDEPFSSCTSHHLMHHLYPHAAPASALVAIVDGILPLRSK